jgi:tripartite-type tricarboxylate transporter receptor subunit TctC
MRGDVQMYFAPVNLAKEQSEGGKVRAIAAATAQRIPHLPNVPTFTEAGLPFVYDSWFGLMAPRGVPRPDRREDQPGLGRGSQDAGNEGEARGAVRHSGRRYAGSVRQDHPG